MWDVLVVLTEYNQYEDQVVKDRYTINGISDRHIWEELGDGWVLGKLSGLLYHTHGLDRGTYYYVCEPEYQCRQCGETPPAGIKFHSKFTQLSNI